MSISSLVRVRLVPCLFVLLAMAACAAEDTSESNSETDRDEQPSTARDGGSRDGGASSRDGGGGKADAGKADAGKGDAGAKSDAKVPSRPDASAPADEDDDSADDDSGDDDSGDDDAADDDSGDDDDTQPASDAGGGKVDAGAGNSDAGGDEEPDPMEGNDDMEPPPAGGGEVITTAEGTKIYVDPSCENVTLPIMDRMIELVGCCIEGMNTCGVSTHKLMIPAAFASMFPHKCRGYDEASMLPAGIMVEIPEMKSCTIPK